MLITDNYGDQLLVARPGEVPSNAHVVMQHSPNSLRQSGRDWSGPYVFVCMRCGREWIDFVDAGPCIGLIESVSSGFGSKNNVLLSRGGLYSFIGPDQMAKLK